MRVQSQNGFDRFEDRFRFHDHAAAAAVRRVIRRVVPVVGVIADVVHVDRDQAALACTLEDTAFKIWGKYFGQQGENLELHSSDSSIINSRALPFLAEKMPKYPKFASISLFERKTQNI
jgi:hypothetical protein